MFGVRGSRPAPQSCILFSFEALPEGEGPASRSELLQGTVSGGPSRQAVILFIALPEEKDNIDPG
jgi:hypothetical protein